MPSLHTTKHTTLTLKSLMPAAAALFAASLLGCTARPPIDRNRNTMAVGQRERHGEHQIRWLVRDRMDKYKDPERVCAYFETMGQRLAPAPIEGELILGQLRESDDAWARLLTGP